MERSQKMREGISLTSNPKNAVNPGKNGRQNRKFCQIFCRDQIIDVFYTIREAPQVTLNAHCGSCIWDIDIIQVLSCVLLP